ncbi:MAG TPA: hypothetical protein VKA48_05590, partial [Gammaproteobacteria bacterium]|nr:hypothetical protein [Gammaproteobacteria bacterium]
AADVTMDVVGEHDSGKELSDSVSNSIDLPDQAQAQGASEVKDGAESDGTDTGDRADNQDMGMDDSAHDLADSAKDGGIDKQEAQDLAKEAREHASEMEQEQEDLHAEHKEAEQEKEEAKQEQEDAQSMQEEQKGDRPGS